MRQGSLLLKQKGERRVREGEVGDAEKHLMVAAVGRSIPIAVTVGDFLRQESQRCYGESMNLKCHINAVNVTIAG